VAEKKAKRNEGRETGKDTEERHLSLSN